MSFDSYLRNYTKDKNNAAQIVTHTRIGSPEHNIYGGAYSVPPEKKAEFYHTYYHQVYLKNAAEYLTERQLPDDFKTTAGDIVNGAILVDLDFRYDADVTERQHTPEHVEDMVFEYVEELKKYFLFEPADTEFEVFVFESITASAMQSHNYSMNFKFNSRGPRSPLGQYMRYSMSVDQLPQT